MLENQLVDCLKTNNYMSNQKSKDFVSKSVRFQIRNGIKIEVGNISAFIQ